MRTTLFAAALMVIAAPAFAQNFTIPAGDYPQAPAQPGWTALYQPAPAPAWTGRSVSERAPVHTHRHTR